MKVDRKSVLVALAVAWIPANVALALIVGKPAASWFAYLAIAPIPVMLIAGLVAGWLGFVLLIRSPEQFALAGVFGVPFLLWFFGPGRGAIVIGLTGLWMAGAHLWARRTTAKQPAQGATYTGGLLLEPRRRRPNP